MLAWIVGALAGLAALALIVVSAAEYRPADVEPVDITAGAGAQKAAQGRHYTVVTLNTGFGALGRGADFFMDGGKSVQPSDKATVRANIDGMYSSLSQMNADAYFLQEVDVDSTRSYGINQAREFQRRLSLNGAFAYNFNTLWVPYPWPMIGHVESGLETLTSFEMTSAERESLPVPFAWPVRSFNLKRCLLTARVPIEGSDKELVLVNLHLEAYDDGEGKLLQTRQLMNSIQAEYHNGNYVVAGGDFNQTFPGGERYIQLEESYWQPGLLTEADLPAGFAFVNDPSSPSCRLLNQPYSGDRSQTQLYLIDGFIVSPNVQVNAVETIDLNFTHTDHNPVRLDFTLKGE
ncbi:MAG: endonuclease [Eubacteriales bacterium]|nr:endonuclease [Eubacteriales bacterium]